MTDDLVRVENLTKHFPVESGFMARFYKSRKIVHAVDDVSFVIKSKETFSLVGETGSGKSSVAMSIARLQIPTSGRIIFDGIDINEMSKIELKQLRRNLQFIFQDPYSSLNPRKTVNDIIGLPLEEIGLARGAEKKKRVIKLLEQVGLVPGGEYAARYPHEFSGGQRQRIGIARALAVNPKFIIADEPVSALDISVRSQIMNLLQDVKKEFGLTYLFIAHDLSVVRYMSDTIAVMHLGKVVELAESEELFNHPEHPYTEALMAAVLVPSPRASLPVVRAHGEPPSPVNPPSGCRFHTRCPYVEERCKIEEPILRMIRPDHLVACHLAPVVQLKNMP
ncbi:MAG: ABC transporter ATP-binding protein [Candidatus Bathyarchaeia archaeon]